MSNDTKNILLGIALIAIGGIAALFVIRALIGFIVENPISLLGIGLLIGLGYLLLRGRSSASRGDP